MAQQQEDFHKHPPKLLNYSKMTTQQLADEGETIIFGGIGKNKEQGAIGKGQCPLCHAFHAGMLEERAPNLFGVTRRASERLKDPRYHIGKPQKRETVQKEAFPGAGTATTPLEYIAETLLCPLCYVPAGYGVSGTSARESPDIDVTKPPVSLKIDDLVAITTWLYLHDGQKPPSAQKILKAYRKFMTPKDWQRVTTIESPEPKPPPGYVSLFATGEEPVEEIFRKAQCTSCHVISGIPEATGTVGPSLSMKSVAPLRLKDQKYFGKSSTTKEYITESILYPSTYVPDGYPDHTMPKVFGSKLSALAIDKMVDYLAEVEEGKEPPPIK
jgi:cytochrome c2